MKILDRAIFSNLTCLFVGVLEEIHIDLFS